MITTRLATEKGSSFKRALAALNEGDTIEADGPEGDFVVDNPAASYVFIAGGIGITPFHSILKEADHAGTKLHVTLLYANRDTSIPYREELDAMQKNNPNLTVHYLIDPERIDADKIKQLVPDLQTPRFYLSGPEPMVKSLAEVLAGLGIAADHIKLDDFPGYPTY
jgi:ferredoxin-NADP reductase